MAKPVQQRRLAPLAVLLCLAFGALGYRLVELQVFRHEELRALGQRNTQRAFVSEPLRGQIRDARGNLLATTAPGKVVCADPSLLGPFYHDVARAVAPLLRVDENELSRRLRPTVRADGRTNQYVVIRRKVPLEVWEEIREIMDRLPLPVTEESLTADERAFVRNLRRQAIFSEEDRIRIYPNGRLAGHVLGFLNYERQGVGGIESVFDTKLRGVTGWRRTELNVRRHEVVPFRVQNVEPRDGMNVVLTLDSGLQHILETELHAAMVRHEPVSVTGIIVRPRTGEILAMATMPNFDPNHPGAFPVEDLRNRAIEHVLEPGSTFKIVPVAAALNEGIVQLDDTIFCEHGRFFYAGRTLPDVGSHGWLSVKNVITKSSNIGTAKIGIQMGETMLHEYLLRFGFNERTGVPLPGEVPGTVHPVRNWSRVSIAQIPMGQGIAVTPLQMTMAMSAIANDGRLMRPMLVRRIEDADGEKVVELQPQMVRQAVSQTAARQMVAALKTVTMPGENGHRAGLEHYVVAGKTGTAQKPGPGGYPPGMYYSSFIGFFPADYPELCISIIFDEPNPNTGYYGGLIAAPVFKQVAERAARYLNIKPEIIHETGPRDHLATGVSQRNF